MEKKKILIIMASPRKGGNTELLTDELIKGINNGAGAEVDLVNLRDKDIVGCKEIYACEKTGRCVIPDSFDEIYEKLETCDCLVIATPIFFYAPPAQLKALIDRSQAFFMRKYFLKDPVVPKDQPKRPTYLLALGGTKGAKLFDATFLILEYFFDSLDLELKDSLLYRSVDKKGDILKHPTALKDAFELGVKIASD
ncbi:MAG: flavodoxin family protein [Gammaproteobacteria bacterium]|jgi:multimeric flavodoxin WrbA